jgi:serine/threonine-protein kinase
MKGFDDEPITAGLQRQSHTLLFQLAKIAVMVFVVVGTAAFAGVFGISIYETYFKIPAEVEVPAITGKQLSEANEILERVGLRLAIQESRHTNRHPEKVIISQDPAAGRRVRGDRQILAVVSLGPELVDVPDLKGKTLREARIVLSNSRLKIGKVTFKPEKMGEPEQILQQNPSGGERVAKGRAVDLQVQKGSSSATTNVPNWEGTPMVRMGEMLKGAHLQLGSVVWVFNDFVPKGEVVAQVPAQGHKVAYNSEVELQVSAGRTQEKLFKQRRLRIQVPRGTRSQRVSVVINSEIGADRIFEGATVSGDQLELLVAGWHGSEVEVYFNDRLSRREKL